MKSRNILKLILVSMITFTSVELYAMNNHYETTSISHDEIVTKEFKVFGNCGMCKKTIESALTNVQGIVKATWSKETKMIEVTFDEHAITLDEIKKKIAGVGYDTEKFKATDKIYKGLPGCCQYDRE